MQEHTYRIIDVVGTSREGVDQAIRNAVARASKTVRHLDWFEVSDIRGYIADDAINHFQVAVKLGFRIEEPE
jgi:hypothetical protein